MKWTSGRKKDKETILYFVPQILQKIEKTEKDWEMFFQQSERGKEPEEKTYGYDAIVEGKEWRGISMAMYEEGILDGSMPYMVILEDMPRNVIDFLKKELFKGFDAKLIENCYKQLNF